MQLFDAPWHILRLTIYFNASILAIVESGKMSTP